MSFEQSNGNSESPWAIRIANANRFYDQWESTYRCRILEDYIKGFQWKNKSQGLTQLNYRPYQLNLFWATIKVKLAGFLFQKPSFVITPEPGNGGNWDMDLAMKSASIKQDTLNTIVRNRNMNFVKHTKRAAKDSFSRFGIIEVGYAADWRNPQKEIPELKSWEDSDVPEKKDKVVQDNEVPLNERFYIKRINPKRFRVSVSEAMDLNDHEWVGYYDFCYTRELEHTKGIKWPKDYTGGSLSADYSTGLVGDGQENKIFNGLNDGKLSKVWHIWDLVSKERLLLLDGYMDEPLWSGGIERLPLIDLRWDEDNEGFYPIPPSFQWISQQDEINEAREQTRSYRRRFTRKFQYVDGTVDELEVEKFFSGPDGIGIKVKKENAISAIDNPEQGHTAENALLLAEGDFNVISGTSTETRATADRETATAAKITSARASIRESAEQMDFSNFIETIGEEILCQAKEKLVDGIWIKDSSGAIEETGTLMQTMGPVFKWIRSQDLSDGYDSTIMVDVENQTPQAQAQQNQSFAQFLTYVHNFPEISLDPDLIREAAYRCGYRNEKIISKMQKTALMNMAAQAAQMAWQGSGAGNQLDQGQNANNIAAQHLQNMNPENPVQSQQKSLEQIQ